MSTTIFDTVHELRQKHIEACLERYLNHFNSEEFKSDLNKSQWKFSDSAIQQILKKYNLSK